MITDFSAPLNKLNTLARRKPFGLVSIIAKPSQPLSQFLPLAKSGANSPKARDILPLNFTAIFLSLRISSSQRLQLGKYSILSSTTVTFAWHLILSFGKNKSGFL